MEILIGFIICLNEIEMIARILYVLIFLAKSQKPKAKSLIISLLTRHGERKSIKLINKDIHPYTIQEIATIHQHCFILRP